MAEATVVTVTALLLLLGYGDNNNLPVIVVATTTSWTTMTTMSLLGSWRGPDNGNNIVAPDVNGGNFWFGLYHFDFQLKGGDLFWLCYAPR
jgi:hypothetical protein